MKSITNLDQCDAVCPQISSHQCASLEMEVMAVAGGTVRWHRIDERFGSCTVCTIKNKSIKTVYVGWRRSNNVLQENILLE